MTTYTESQWLQLNIYTRSAGYAGYTPRVFRSIVDDVAPVISVVSPAAGSTLASSSTAIQVRVKDYGIAGNDGVAPVGNLKRAIVYVTFTDGTPAELAWNGTSFETKYSGSTATAIGGGYDFSLVRTGGWRTNPSVKSYGLDIVGNETNFTSYSWVFDPADDVTAPTFAANTPAAGATLTLNQSVTLDVTDASTLSRIILFVSFADGTQETVYKSSGFTSNYSAGSSVSTVSTTQRFVVVRASGWKQNPTFTAYARDSAGNEHLSTTSIAYVYTPDTTGPSLAANTPSSGSTLASSSTAIVADVTDTSGVGLGLIYVKFSTGEYEVAYDGSAWTPGYDGTSARTTISGGYRYSIVRDAGWLTNPQVKLEAIDALGNRTDLASLSYVFTPTPPDTTPPAISLLTPSAGSTLTGSSQNISLRLSEVVGGVQFIVASYDSGLIQEVVYDSVSGFGALYATNSSKTLAGSSADFVFRRNAGWGKNPAIRIFAMDAVGNTLDTTLSFVFVGTPAPTGQATAYQLQYNDQTAVEDDSNDFGFDVLAFPDIDPTLEPQSGVRVLGDALARRLTTERGNLRFHPNYGFDIREYLNSEMADETLFKLKADVELECEKDERVEAADAAVSYDPNTQTITVRIALETSIGPFRLVLGVSQLSTSILYEDA